MNVQEGSTRAERPMQSAQSVADALRGNSSEGPREKGDIERSLGQADVDDVGHAEGDDRFEGLWRRRDRLLDTVLLGIEREDRPRLRGVAPRHPSVAAPHLHDILVTEIDELVEDPRFVALGVNGVTHRSSPGRVRVRFLATWLVRARTDS